MELCSWGLKTSFFFIYTLKFLAEDWKEMGDMLTVNCTAKDESMHH